MKYKIFALVKPEELFYQTDYKHNSPFYMRTVLEEFSIEGMQMEHDTMENALIEIEKFMIRLSKTELTIIPIISIK